MVLSIMEEFNESDLSQKEKNCDSNLSEMEEICENDLSKMDRSIIKKIIFLPVKALMNSVTYNTIAEVKLGPKPIVNHLNKAHIASVGIASPEQYTDTLDLLVVARLGKLELARDFGEALGSSNHNFGTSNLLTVRILQKLSITVERE
ncbi:unnamed protein product [Arabis nemorensis]|uniref:Uncharacterized protein n=1 Tax=Arabis nemorensis TaxID=586526 RepID=A0A565CF14_9BRAS|nr:unnamed protein product [Arabis nemorensis]